MRLHQLGLSVALILAFLPSPAMAQAEFLKDNLTKIVRKAGIHVSTSFADPMDKEKVIRDGSYGVSVGLAPGRSNGWRYPVGIAWFTEELRSPVTGASFTKFQSRPVIAGIGYGWHFGKLSTGASLQAGWAFNSAKPADDIDAAFNMPLHTVAVDIGDTFVVRPQVKVEYFLTNKFTVRSSFNYIMEHPTVTITTPAGRTSERWNASNMSLSMGVGFYPFRK